MTFEQILQNRPLLLMEAAIIERLRRTKPDLLHPQLAIAPLVRTAEGRSALSALYREYISVAESAGLPLVLNTPTWRASRGRSDKENTAANLNADAVQFMFGLKKEYPDLFIGGQIGCKNDCYKPEEALSREAARGFHRWQVERLSEADFLYGVTLPEINEALGMAQAMALSGRPYILSFVISNDGRMLDGTPLDQAIDIIDTQTDRAPLGYGVNCCYPSFLQSAKLSGKTSERMLSVQANASSLTHEELETAETVKSDPIEDWSSRMLNLQHKLGLKILGGCCGTTADHLRHLT